MKFFSFAAVVLASCTSFVAATMDAATVVANIQALTLKSSQTNDMVSSITVVNVLFIGPQVAQSLGAIVNIVQTDVQGMLPASGQSPTVYVDSDAKLIVGALTTFVQVHQALLNTIIGKHGLLSLFFFTEPVAAALRALEGVVDTFAYALIAEIPTQAGPATAQTNALHVTIDGAITVYSN